MPNFTFDKIFLKLLFLAITSILALSCKEDTQITGSDGSDNPPAAVSIIVTAPVDGDSLVVGSSFEITWTTTSTSTIQIEYTTDNGANWNTIATEVEATGSYIWKPIPNELTNEGRIKVSTTDGFATDQSDGLFSIVKSTTKSLSLQKPTGGEVFFVGGSTEIKWESNAIENVKIEFSSNGGTAWNTVFPSYPADSSYYTWSPIPNSPSANCYIRVSDVSTATLKDSNSTPFGISIPQDIVVTVPNGGEIWPGKSSQVINWSSSQVENVKIEYTSDNGLNWTTIVESTPSDGYFVWEPVPNTPSTNAKIRITDASDGFPSDASDNTFTIEPEPDITVTVPNGGEEWMAGSTQYIRWLAATNPAPGNVKQLNLKNRYVVLSDRDKKGKEAIVKSVDNVKIEYSTNSGAEWFTITESTPNNGTFVWNSVPSHNSALCFIRISDENDGVPFDLSDSAFVIYTDLPQQIIITSPNGSEEWETGSTQNITWQSDGITAVKIEYTINNGVSWNTIVENTPSDGFYTWSPVPNSASTNCKIRISDATDGVPYDLSDASFTISPEPGIEVLSPNGGETWVAGTANNITWFSENIPNVKIEFSTNNGANWTTITESTESDGVFSWTIPGDINSSLCRIKVSDADDGVPFDVSDNIFTATNQVEESITITTPNGAEVWEAGTSQNITWSSINVPKVKIEYTTDNGLNWYVIVDSTISDGSYEWNPVPNTSSTLCKLRISDASDDNPVDVSDEPFTITPVAYITITSPNGGESWTAGTVNMIEWESSNVTNVTIEHSPNNGLSWSTIVVSTPSDGSYQWSSSVPSTQNKIRIRDALDGYPVDESDGIFTITEEPSITIIAPNGEEQLSSGTKTNIRWSSVNLTQVTIEFTSNNGASWQTVVENENSDGLYEWTVPDISSSLCKLRISDADDGNPSDISDANFTINQEPLGITVTAPNGGEAWEGGTSQTVTWTSNGVSNVKIEYTINNGVNWTTIVESTPSDGYYTWNPIPNTPSTNCKIKVSDVVNNFSDQSDAVFTIAPEAAIQVISPNGGEKWISGTQQAITWNSTNIANVKIEFTTNNGASWTMITESVESDGDYTWTVVDENSSLVKIRISDADDGVPSDVSDNNFSITDQVAKSIKVTSPNGGEQWEAGTTQLITWEASNITDVNIQYTTNNGLTWTTVVNNLQSSGAYLWSIPSLNSTQCKISISDAVDGSPVDESDNTFRITPIQSLTVISPNGGEVYPGGTGIDIQWASEGVENVKIEYTYTNGTPVDNDTDGWFTLIGSTPSDGSYEASFTQVSNEYRIRISDATDTIPSDESNGLFTVTEQPGITVLSPNGDEDWLVDETFEITWEANVVQNVKIEYSINGGGTWSTITASTPNNGLYNWNIDPNIYPIAYRSDLCKIRISSVEGNGNPSDETDAYFTIHPREKLVRVVAPNGGESVVADSTTRIEWLSAGVDQVRIEYTIDNGTSWTVIENSVVSDGAYDWNVPAVSSSLARIRITDVSADAGTPPNTDVSDSYFSIVTSSGP